MLNAARQFVSYRAIKRIDGWLLGRVYDALHAPVGHLQDPALLDDLALGGGNPTSLTPETPGGAAVGLLVRAGRWVSAVGSGLILARVSWVAALLLLGVALAVRARAHREHLLFVRGQRSVWPFYRRAYYTASLATAPPAAKDAVLLAVAGTFQNAGGRYVLLLVADIHDKATLAMNRDLMRLCGATPGLEHHERPEYLDRMALLRDDTRVLADALRKTVVALVLVIRVLTTAMLLSSVHPVLLVLPAFSLPSLWTGARSRRVVQDARESSAGQGRLLDHVPGPVGGRGSASTSPCWAPRWTQPRPSTVGCGCRTTRRPPTPGRLPRPRPALCATASPCGA